MCLLRNTDFPPTSHLVFFFFLVFFVCCFWVPDPGATFSIYVVDVYLPLLPLSLLWPLIFCPLGSSSPFQPLAACLPICLPVCPIYSTTPPGTVRHNFRFIINTQPATCSLPTTRALPEFFSLLSPPHDLPTLSAPPDRFYSCPPENPISDGDCAIWILPPHTLCSLTKPRSL